MQVFRAFCCSERGLSDDLGSWWPATGGAWASDRAVSKAGNKVGTLLRNPPPVGGGNLWPRPRGDCCRSDALLGVGRETTKKGPGAVCPRPLVVCQAVTVAV